MADSNVSVPIPELPGVISTEVTVSLSETGPTDSKIESNIIENVLSGSTETGISAVIINTVNNTIDAVEKNIVSKMNLEKYLTFVTNNDVKQVVMVLTNDSSAVHDIINMIDLILADGKIDLGDAPILLALVKKIITLRTSDLKLSENLTLEHFLAIIKLVFTILAKEGLLKIANTDQFITDITKIINLLEHGEQITKALPCCAPLTSWFASSKK
jgi:hypothetical protein